MLIVNGGQNMFKQFKELPFKPFTNSLLIEKGTVEICPLFQSGVSVSILKLSPGAKIKKHRHTVDNEKYILIETADLGAEIRPQIMGEVCMAGGEHEIENTSDKDWYVLSIKWPATV